MAKKQTPAKTSSIDANGDGTISPAEAAAAGGSPSGGLDVGNLGVAPLGAGTGAKGAPLLPYKTTNAYDPSGLTFQNNSQLKGPLEPKNVPIRYYEADTLSPLAWSPEQRAQLQKAFYTIGLYGNDKVTLGSWGGADQGAFAELLKYSNVNGLTWYEQLANWKAAPPQDLLQQIKSTAPAKPTIHLTNPDDIRATARAVSQQLLGKEDPSFVASSVPAVQGNEAGYQQQIIDNSAAGGGGQVVDPGNTQNVLQEKLRREQPIAVDGNSFVNTFTSFLSMLGAQGGEHA